MSLSPRDTVAACNELEKMSWFQWFYGNLTSAAINTTLTASPSGELILTGSDPESLGSLLSKAMVDAAKSFITSNIPGPGTGKSLLFSPGFLAAVDALSTLSELRRREANIRMVSRNDPESRDRRHRRKLSILMAVLASDHSNPIMRRFNRKVDAGLWLWVNYWRYHELLGRCQRNRPRATRTVGKPPEGIR